MSTTGLSALIPAAGEGLRLGQGPKAWIDIAGRPIAAWLTEKLLATAEEVLLAVPPGDLAQASTLLRSIDRRVRILAGGASRQETILKLVEAARCPQVLIQDVARPFVTKALIARVAAAAAEHGAAAAFLPAEVPVALLEGNRVTRYLPAAAVAGFQAPQSFPSALLLEILLKAQAQGCQRQSTAQLWLDAGEMLYPVPGEKTNIKLTTPEDWLMSRSLTEYLQR